MLVEENFSKTKNKTAEKITGQRFPVKSKVTCKNWAHLDEEKNFGPNSHLRASCTQPFKCYAQVSKWLHFRLLFSKFLFYSTPWIKIKPPTGKTLVNFRFVPNLNLIWTLIISREPIEAFFSAVYPSKRAPGHLLPVLVQGNFLKTKNKQQKKVRGNVFPLSPRSRAKI